MLENAAFVRNLKRKVLSHNRGVLPTEQLGSDMKTTAMEFYKNHVWLTCNTTGGTIVEALQKIPTLFMQSTYPFQFFSSHNQSQISPDSPIQQRSPSTVDCKRETLALRRGHQFVARGRQDSTKRWLVARVHRAAVAATHQVQLAHTAAAAIKWCWLLTGLDR